MSGAASLHPLEEFDLLAGSQGHDRLAPRGGAPDDPAAARPAPLLLGLRREDVDGDDRHLLLLVELLDGGLDLDLVGPRMDGERVLVARIGVAVTEGRHVDRLLADDGTQDDVGGGQGAHAVTSSVASARPVPAYTAEIRSRAGCSMRIASASRMSTTLSESARRTVTLGRFAVERRSASPPSGATTRTLRACPSPAPSAVRVPANVFVFGSALASRNSATTLIASSASFALRALRSATRRIRLLRRCS